MKKIIYNRFDKKLIAKLPVAAFGGRIITVISPEETRKAVDYLLSFPLLGIDTETRPSFKKGKQNIVSLLQVSSEDTCVLFRLNHTGMTEHIVRLLEDTKVPKVGLSLHDDILSLQRRKSFTPGNFIDLQHLVKEIGIEDMSLQKLYANLFQQKISKGQQLSNWEADVLTDKQKSYAATDAWACIMLYKEFLNLKSSGNFSLEVVEEENPGGNDVKENRQSN